MNVLENATRRDIVQLLRRGERPSGEIARVLDRVPPAVSNHLSILLHAGVVRCRAVATVRLYSLDERHAFQAWDGYVQTRAASRRAVDA